jgi:hypothetical protein
MIITVTEPKACDACERNITHSKLCSFCAENRIAELEKALKALIKYNKDLCEWLGYDICTNTANKCFCIHCEVDRAKSTLEAKG